MGRSLTVPVAGRRGWSIPPIVRGLAIALCLATTLLTTACADRVARASVPVPHAPPVPRPTPAPVVFPRDDAPHDNLTEWWYYTGHLAAPDGKRFGFEFVVFQIVRGSQVRAYAAHTAITDHQTRQFHYDQRTQIGGQVPRQDGIDLRVGDWTIRGANGTDRLQTSIPGYALDLEVRATKPAALHNQIGHLSMGPAGDSYYYSRTRMDVTGELHTGDATFPVTGQAWMDHQWGDFITAGGGWDWFALQLEDGRDLMLFTIRDDGGQNVFTGGSLVGPDGTTTDLPASDIQIETLDRWTSPRSGAVYPARWTVAVETQRLRLEVEPVIADQELDTRASTGVVYWEGETTVRGEADGRPIVGLGYVELTGYAQE